MARSYLHVFLNGKKVGVLRQHSNGSIDFEYDLTWLEWEHSLPVSISLPLRENRYVGAPVLNVFDNLLPDNNQIRRHLAQKMKAAGSDTYSLLGAIGRDCVGALQFLSDEKSSGVVGKIEGTILTAHRISGILADLKVAPLGVSIENDFLISIAGAQEKTALLLWKGQWHQPQGTTPTTHILKPQIGKLENGLDLSQSVENEHLCMCLTKELGLPTAKTMIKKFGRKNVLVVERFDRRWTKEGRLFRIPQEDFCQALSVASTSKYQSDGGPGMVDILKFLKSSDDPDTDRKIFFKAQVVFWLLAATDGHAKNFSIHLSPGGRFRLTPLYDVMSVQPSADARQIQKNKMKMAMSVGKSPHYVVDTIFPRHFLQSGELAGMSSSDVKSLLDEIIEESPRAINRTVNKLPKYFPEKLATSIIQGMKKRLKILRHRL